MKLAPRSRAFPGARWPGFGRGESHGDVAAPGRGIPGPFRRVGAPIVGWFIFMEQTIF